MTYQIRRTHYLTYAEVLTLGDKQQEVVKRGMSLEDAQAWVQSHDAAPSTEFSIHPETA